MTDVLLALACIANAAGVVLLTRRANRHERWHRRSPAPRPTPRPDERTRP